MALEEIVIPLIVGATGFFTGWVYRHSTSEAIKEVGKIWRERDDEKDKNIYSVLSLTRPQYYGKQMEADNPPPDANPVTMIDRKIDELTEMMSRMTQEIATVQYDVSTFIENVEKVSEKVDDISNRLTKVEGEVYKKDISRT